MKRVTPSLLLAALLAGAAGPTSGQVTPFDMSRERAAILGPDGETGAAEITVLPAAKTFRRLIVPAPKLTLDGENAERSWSVFLTPEQAASPATLEVGYRNAIVIAPEASTLFVEINGTPVVTTPVAAPDQPGFVTGAVPAGVLRPGFNHFRFRVHQRHRTDCTIQSTYELWTEIVGASTALAFADVDAGTMRRLEDIRAVGVDQAGRTTFRMVAPSLGRSSLTPALARLVGALSVIAGMPNQATVVEDQIFSDTADGTLTVVAGAFADLRTLFPDLAEPTGPEFTFLQDPRSAGPLLVVTGPDAQAFEAAVDMISRPVDRPVGAARAGLATQTWRAPDPPLMLAGDRRPLSAFGVATQEFSGRRFRTDFQIAVPSDFYANNYGSSTLLLDAAYTDEVLPGSHIDVYVNDHVASTVPINTAGGAILRHLPVQIPLRHFRPGVNTVAIEAILRTASDEACAPGATALDTNRFVLFDSSEFVLPDFARIAVIPNLSALGGTGFPFSRSEKPMPLVLVGDQREVVSAALTFLGRLSLTAGRPIPVDLEASAASSMDADAVFIGPVTQIPPGVLPQIGIDDAARSEWTPGAGESVIDPVSTDETFDQWKERLSGSGWRGQVSTFEDWLNRTFGISSSSFHLARTTNTLIRPSPSTSLILAQGTNPTETGAWTLLTAPTAAALVEGTRALAEEPTWRQVGGRASAYSAATGEIQVTPVEQFRFLQTQPMTLANLRLISTNWLSGNILWYSLLLAALCLILGLTTSMLLRKLGRQA